jgi:hypothetical protein
VRTWFNRCGDRELFWVMMVLIVLFVFGLNALAGAAPTGPAGPSDWELASVIAGKDTAPEVEQKLGRSPCLVPNSTGDTISYLYNIPGQKGTYYLRLDVNGHVDAITVSQDPPIAGVCYAPVHVSIPAKTGKGIELGATIDEVVKLYGEPTERFTVGPMARYRYVAMYHQSFEWDLVFRNGRLVEWTVSIEE